MVEYEVSNRPIEYWISRSTDPFTDENSRKQNVQKLCERVNCEAVDQLVRKCGEKVHNRVGKFRFLNQIVKLVTPKYLGARTSPEVKELSIKLLYSWQKSMRHVEKFKEVYDSLKEHKLIAADPVIPEDEILVVQCEEIFTIVVNDVQTLAVLRIQCLSIRRRDVGDQGYHRVAPPKLATFEDEEKARLLKELLNSSNPDDLQAANRLIQTLVKTEQQKLEEQHKRADDLQCVRQLCKRLEDALIEKTAENLGITPDIVYTDAKMKALAEELLAVRPQLFRFASDATENDEEALVEILTVNDQVNQLLQKYRNYSQSARLRQQR
ncbi:VHS domain protein, partial [Dictyocaulus viviparus]